MRKQMALLFMGVAVLCSGQMCGAPAPTPEPEYGRLDVTPTLREACAGFADRDADIQANITTCEASRLYGNSKTYIIQTILGDCGANQACRSCGTAIVNQVFEDAPPLDRLAVTGKLRDACPLNTDAELQMYLSNMENRRLNGSTRQDEVNMNYEACYGGDDAVLAVACMTCWTAITDQIYPLE